MRGKVRTTNRTNYIFLGFTDTYRSRILNMQLINHMEVLVIDTGAVGSYVAYFLAAAASLIIPLSV